MQIEILKNYYIFSPLERGIRGVHKKLNNFSELSKE
jgi:hypothetical protein